MIRRKKKITHSRPHSGNLTECDCFAGASLSLGGVKFKLSKNNNKKVQIKSDRMYCKSGFALILAVFSS